MDAKVTLSFDQEIIEKAKEFAKANNISLSRLLEHLLRKVVDKSYPSLDEIPISNWVSEIAEGKAEYKKRGKPNLKEEFYGSRK